MFNVVFNHSMLLLQFRLIIEDGMHKAGFLVNILCERPRCILLPFISNIGNVPINVRNEQTLYVINLAHVPMEWLILELAYDNANQNFYLINNIIKPPNGILHNYGEKAYLKYKIFAKVRYNTIYILNNLFLFKIRRYQLYGHPV